MAELQDWFYKHLSIIEVTALFPEKLSSGVLGLRSRAHLDVLNTLYSQQWLIPNTAYKWLSSILTPAIPNQVKNWSLHTRTYTTSQKYSAASLKKSHEDWQGDDCSGRPRSSDIILYSYILFLKLCQQQVSLTT